MPISKPVEPWLVYVDRHVITRMAVPRTSESDCEAGRQVVRDLESGHTNPPANEWKPVRTEYRVEFVYRSNDGIYSPEEKTAKEAGHVDGK